MAGDNNRIGEFDIIARYFAPLTGGDPLTFGLTDDAALIDVPEGQSLVATKDLMVAGIHFLPNDPAALIGRKLLRVNLSDLAAMGAAPKAYLLGIALPEAVDETWIAAFAEGLNEDQATFGVHVIGGDTVSTTGPLTLSLTALGTVERGRALSRAGAMAGDDVYVSGTIGDGALGLKMLQGELRPVSQELIDRYRLPRPQVELGQALVGIARAAADISDGLIADLGHICDASGCGATIHEGDVPLSPAARAALDGEPTLISAVLTGGDDYELIFTAPPAARDDIVARAVALDLAVTRIGQIGGESGVNIVAEDGSVRRLKQGGFTHF